MTLRTLIVTAGTLLVLSTPVGAFATDGVSPDDASTAVKSIQTTADEIVAGKYAKPHAMRGPARTIALAWEKAEPVYAKNGNALVETHELNSAIVALEGDFKGSYQKTQADAKSVSQAAATLLEAAAPTPAASPGASPAPSPSGSTQRR